MGKAIPPVVWGAIECFQAHGNRADELKERFRLVEFFLETDEWKRASAEARSAFEQAGRSGLLEMGYDVAVSMALEAFDRGEQETAREWLSGLEWVVAQLTRREGADEAERPHPTEIGERREWEDWLASLEAASRIWSRIGDRRRLGRAQEMMAYLSRL